MYVSAASEFSEEHWLHPRRDGICPLRNSQGDSQREEAMIQCPSGIELERCDKWQNDPSGSSVCLWCACEDAKRDLWLALCSKASCGCKGHIAQSNRASNRATPREKSPHPKAHVAVAEKRPLSAPPLNVLGT